MIPTAVAKKLKTVIKKSKVPSTRFMGVRVTDDNSVPWTLKLVVVNPGQYSERIITTIIYGITMPMMMVPM